MSVNPQSEIRGQVPLVGPQWGCAGLWANLRCVEGGGKRTAGDEQTQLHMIKLEADPPPTLQAVGAE